MDPVKRDNNIDAGLGLYGDPQELPKRFPNMSNEQLKQEVWDVETDTAEYRNLRKEFYEEYALTAGFDEKHAQKMMTLDDEYRALLAAEMQRRNLTL